MTKSNKKETGNTKSSGSGKSQTEKETQESEKSQAALDPEIFDGLPPEIRDVVRTGISMQRFSGSMPNPLLSKITESHIDKILELSDKEDNNSFKDAQSSKRYNLFYFLAFVGLFIFITLYLAKEDKDLFTDILKIVISVAGGFGGGYGYKSYLDSKKNK